jgi:hypothetical protein
MNQKESGGNGENIFEHIKKLKKAAPRRGGGGRGGGIRDETAIFLSIFKVSS